MAVFNPQGPQTQFQEFTNVSRPISDVSADRSTAIAISGGAQLLDQAVKLTDQTFKQDIDKQVYEGTDKQREAYTSALESVRNQQYAAVDQKAGQPLSLLPEDNQGPVPPQPLQQGIQRVEAIGTAIAQGGNKINDTLYTASLNAMAKQLRNQYPGYRDYIDEKIKAVTGMDPANAYYRNLMEDINRGMEANKTDMNATLGSLREMGKEGFKDVNGVGASDVSAMLRAGRITIPQAEKWINDSKNVEWNIKQRAAARKDRQENDADALINAKKDVSLDTGQIIQQGWNTMTIGQNTDTFEKMFRFVTDNAGNQAVRDERSVAIAYQMKALRTKMFESAWQKATQGGESSVLTKFGGDANALREHINGNFAMLDRAIDDISKGDWASANSHMQFNKAIRSDMTNVLYNAPDEAVRKYNRTAAALSDISPNASAEFFKAMISADVPMREKEWLKSMKLDMITQVDKTTGKMTSLTNAIENAQAIKASPKTSQELVKTVEEIGNKNLAESHRVNVVRSFFDPQINGAILSDKNFKTDYYDPQTKRRVPGKYSVFTRFSADNVATNIYELNKAHPELVPMYRETMSKEFGEQLFSREIKTLGDSNRSSDINAPYKIGFSNENGQAPRLVFVDRQNRELTMTQAAAINAPVGEINRLNTGMAGLYNVYSKTGSKDPNTEVLSVISKYGFQQGNLDKPDRGWTGEFTDVPRMIWNSLIASQQEKMQKIRDRLAPKEGEK